MRLNTVKYMKSTYQVTTNHETERPFRKGTWQMYHMIIRGILVRALRMSMRAKFTIRIFGTVRRVLNRTSNRQIMPFPIIDPNMTTVIIKMCGCFSSSWQEDVIFSSPIVQPAHWKPIQYLQPSILYWIKDHKWRYLLWHEVGMKSFLLSS